MKQLLKFSYGLKLGSLRPVNCCFRSLKGQASIANPENKLYSLAYKVQQTFFVPLKKKT